MGHKIVIVGSGVIGLYTGYVLSQQDRAQDITYVAEYMPGDQSDMYTSPWAGGNFSTVSGDSDAELLYDKLSYPNLQKLLDDFGPEMGIAKLPAADYWGDGEELPSEKKLKDLESYVEDFRIVDKEELPQGCTFGIKYTTFNFFCPKYIAFLKQYLESRGATFVRRKLSHIDEAFALFPDRQATETVFNCTGIGAHLLGGVADKNVYPTRGQVVVVRAPHIQENRGMGTRHFATYIIPRPYSNGQVILGGFMQRNNWDARSTYGYETTSILERTLKLFPEINDYGRIPVDVLRECSGLRPSRLGGTRIEKQVRDDGKIVIHNYGAGGTGYQSGFGMALTAVNLLQDQPKPKL